MPEQSHPPYVPGARTIPRQLNRWLDVNAQNGSLRRTQTFISIPPFSIANDSWLGYSEIIGQFNFAAPNNFSFKLSSNGNVIPVNTNYTLCVSFIDSDNNVKRYLLIRSTDDIIYDTIPQYTGQPIQKNFIIEIWSTSSNEIVETSTITIYTSVLGDLDYRYGLDRPLSNPADLCEGQQSILGTSYMFPITVPSVGAMTLWFDPWWNDGNPPSQTDWYDRLSDQHFIGNNVQIASTTNTLTLMGGQQFQCGAIVSPQQIFFDFIIQDAPVSSNTQLLYLDDGASNIELTWTTTNLLFIVVDGVHTLTLYGVQVGVEYIVAITTSSVNGTTMSLYNANGLGELQSDSIVDGVDFSNMTSVTIGPSSNDITFRNLIAYTQSLSSGDYLAMLQYVASYQNFILAPVEIPSGHGLTESLLPLTMVLPFQWGACVTGQGGPNPPPPPPPSEGTTIGVDSNTSIGVDTVTGIGV